ncbi:hypothetical protein BKA93DRAFT_548771 [Sparassis latifolia]
MQSSCRSQIRKCYRRSYEGEAANLVLRSVVFPAFVLLSSYVSLQSVVGNALHCLVLYSEACMFGYWIYLLLLDSWQDSHLFQYTKAVLSNTAVVDGSPVPVQLIDLGLWILNKNWRRPHFANSETLPQLALRYLPAQ